MKNILDYIKNITLNPNVARFESINFLFFFTGEDSLPPSLFRVRAFLRVAPTPAKRKKERGEEKEERKEGREGRRVHAIFAGVCAMSILYDKHT